MMFVCFHSKLTIPIFVEAPFGFVAVIVANGNVTSCLNLGKSTKAVHKLLMGKRLGASDLMTHTHQKLICLPPQKKKIACNQIDVRREMSNYLVNKIYLKLSIYLKFDKLCLVTSSQLAKMKNIFLTCHCLKIYGVETDGLKSKVPIRPRYFF